MEQSETALPKTQDAGSRTQDSASDVNWGLLLVLLLCFLFWGTVALVIFFAV